MFIVDKKPNSRSGESYKVLRTNIQYSSFDKEYKVIVVTSSERGEGKTTVSGNLAISLAQGGHKVILIDCDLRKPSIHKRFKISNISGLTQVLIGETNVENAIQKYNNSLHILTSGKIPPNPSEMLGSKAMTMFLNELRERYDYIILDTPPVQAVTDGQILSTKADGTVLVVRAKRTGKKSIIQSKILLDKVNATIIGVVLNGVDSTKKSYQYYDESK